MNGLAISHTAIVLFVGLLAAAAITDIVWLRIPNWISIGIALLFLVAAMAAPRVVNWWVSHFAAGFIVFLFGIAIFACGKIGGGDVKLLAAVALWFGLTPLPELLLAIGVIGGVVSIACLILRVYGSGAWLELLGMRAVVLEKGQGVPYAVAIAAGCCLTFDGLLS
jgi:prepilin peptidase CpaA